MERLLTGGRGHGSCPTERGEVTRRPIHARQSVDVKQLGVGTLRLVLVQPAPDGSLAAVVAEGAVVGVSEHQVREVLAVRVRHRCNERCNPPL